MGSRGEPCRKGDLSLVEADTGECTVFNRDVLAAWMVRENMPPRLGDAGAWVICEAADVMAKLGL